ncbi:glycosyltransferase family 4 protein [Candidatus Dojkabacteria bacterium]|nr:glycosyltransferase family 4 protein [Candidatus Dojkabacteria bacterium]
MRIGIDVSMIDVNKAGIGYYAHSLIKALAEVDGKNEYFLITHDGNLLKGLRLPENFSIIQIKAPSGNLKWMLRCLRPIRELELDYFISPSNLFWGCVLRNCVTIVHDIGQVLYPKFFPKKGNIFYRIELNWLLRFGGIVITPSKAVKRDIESKFKLVRSKVFVVTEGLHDWTFAEYSKVEKEAVIEKYKLPSKYVLSVGTLEPRKNLINAILGFSEFLRTEPDYKFVIVGKKGWFYDEIFEVVKEYDLQDLILFLGYVPDEDLPVIYDLSHFVVSLSYYEGFGLPLIEANARKKLVLASDIPAYKELDISAMYVEETSNPIKVGRAMNVISNKKFEPKPKLFDTYSWKSSAKKLLRILGNK